MSKGVMKTPPKQKPTADPYANLSILELMDHITNTTEDLQEVIRKLDDLSEDTEVWKNQVDSAYRDYLEELEGYEGHLKKVEEYVQRKKHLSIQLAGISDAFKSRMD
jgi:DNA repair exonuclease SbcCD ATPase subunit